MPSAAIDRFPKYHKVMKILDRYLVSIDNITELMNLSEAEYVRSVWGSKYLPLTLMLPITFVYVIIFVTGVFGNVMTCVVIKYNPAMQTAMNLYLFNLAVSDLLLLILGLPNELGILWQQYPWKLGVGLCKIRAFVSEMSSYASVLTIVVFSLERYLAICHPLHLYTMSGLKRPVRFIIAVWVLAFFFALPFAVYTTVNYVEYPPKSGRYSEESAICAMLLPNMPKFPIYEISCFIFFLMPMLFIAVLYVRMGLRIQSNGLGQSIEGAVHGETKQSQSRKTIIRMLSAVVITFFICWAPFHAQRLLYVYQVSTFDDINEWLYPLGGCLYYFSTTINPILYNLMSTKYRKAFKKTLLCASTNLSITREDLISGKESTVYDCKSSRRASKFARVKSAHYQRSTKQLNVPRANEIHCPSAESRYDDEDDEDHGSAKRSCDVLALNIVHEVRSVAEPRQESRRPSLVVQSSNGSTACQSSERANGTPTNETCVSFSYQTHLAPMHRNAAVVDRQDHVEKSNCTFCLRDEIDDESGLTDNLNASHSKMNRHDSFDKEHARRRKREQSFTESRV